MPLAQTINIFVWSSASSNDFWLIKYKIEFWYYKERCNDHEKLGGKSI